MKRCTGSLERSSGSPCVVKKCSFQELSKATLEDVPLDGTRQFQQDTLRVLHPCEVPGGVPSTVQKVERGVPGAGRGAWGVGTWWGQSFSRGGWESSGDDGRETCIMQTYLMPLSCTLENG